MTFRTALVIFVQCDSGDHPFDSIHKLEVGPAVTANDALRTLGWRYSTRLKKHYCPDCARVARMVN